MSGLKSAVDGTLRLFGYKRIGRRLVRVPSRSGSPNGHADAAAATQRNLELCSDHRTWDIYYKQAEGYMQSQWDAYIWPRLQGADFSVVLELAPGVGRNTALLLPLIEEYTGGPGEIHLVEYNGTALAECQRRFADYSGRTRLFYYQNDGKTLGDGNGTGAGRRVGDASVSLIYSWDSMVHFDREVIRAYVREFARVLQPGGTGLVHHSNLADLVASGRTQAKSTNNFFENPEWRSEMSATLFRSFCEEAGLEVVAQDLIPWAEVEDIDCISRFRKPGK